MLDYSGTDRGALHNDHLSEADLILTMYGTLRRDAAKLSEFAFNCVILDEAQAIDRAHRIGQDRSVFAYRLIAKDTVEERIVELQARKRAVANAIITTDNSALAGLTRQDLELLLS